MANQENDRTQTGRTSGGASKPAGNASSKPASQPNEPAANKANQPIATKSTDAGIDTGGNIRATASGLYAQAKDTASETYDAVANKATSALEERKSSLSTGLKTVADSFRKTGTELRTTGEPSQLTDLTSKYSGTAAAKLDQLAGYFERKDLRAMMRDVEGFARRNPAIFLGAAFGVGLLAARFLKSTPPGKASTTTTGAFGTESRQPLPAGDRPNPPSQPIG